MTNASPEMLALRTKSRRTFLLIFFICLSPIVASYLAFYFWRPSGHDNHGELIQPPQPITWPAHQPALLGKWVMVLAAPASCDNVCKRALYYMRQVRIAQSDQMDRVARAWVVTDGGTPNANVMSNQEGLVVLSDEKLARQLEPARIHLVDPLGNLMMRFSATPDPKAMMKDLDRLLKYSSLGK
ncbi:MAG TPA: hypothetical protein VFW00_11650 [Rhodocyclaceae bacterium]|nr:hypothetical protein [Rhodocyclaceae bacterium]